MVAVQAADAGALGLKRARPSRRGKSNLGRRSETAQPIVFPGFGHAEESDLHSLLLRRPGAQNPIANKLAAATAVTPSAAP